MRGKQRPKIFAKLFPVVLIGIVAFVFWANTATTNPTDALAQANKLLQHGQLEEAESFISIALKDDRLGHWAQLTEARLLERQENWRKAVKAYREIPAASAASIDARLGMLRLKNMLTDEDFDYLQLPRALNDSLGELETEARLANRNDLLPEITFIRAQEAKAMGDNAHAASLYQAVRRSAPASPIARQARNELYKLLAGDETIYGTQPVAALIEEAKLLIEEKDFVPALEKVQRARSKTSENSPAYFEALLVEESILRKLKRNEEADHMLLTISADGQPGNADVAMIRIAKNAWNINDHHRALEFIDKIRTRFPQSLLIDEALYVEGRILEEMGLTAEAKEAYGKLSQTGRQPIDRVRALRRIAWLQLMDEDYQQAAQNFANAKKTARTALDVIAQSAESNQEREKAAIRDLREEQSHSAFWEAFAAAKANTGADTGDLLNTLQHDQPHGYYALLARRTLGKEGKALNPPAGCSKPADESFIQQLKAFDNPALRLFAQNEIDWYFLRSLKSPYPLNGKLNDEEIAFLASRAQLYIAFAKANRAIELSEMALTALPPEHRCENMLLDLSFPVVEREAFEAAAKANNVPLALLLAIARTESRFDPQATSPVGALGLMQLMPQTAKAEGWDEKQELFDPPLNTALGARHLARLLGEYGGEITYATAAYNAGASPVNRWRSRFPDVPVEMWVELLGYPETLKYVKRVKLAMDFYERKLKAEQSPPKAA